jgi:excisionase family DNA binding protein
VTARHAGLSADQIAALPPILRAEDVSAWLDISKDLTYRLASKGELPSLRLGGRALRFSKAAVEAFLRGDL